MITISKEQIDVVLAIIQVVTLVTLIIYVWKTWEIASATREATQAQLAILEEAREARTQEYSPYVIPYFDVPQGQSRIYLVIENIGRNAATNVAVQFEPRLTNSYGSEINEMPLIRDGIALLPPRHAMRVYFDDTRLFFRSHWLTRA
jgi:hypothetical protein